MIIRCKAVVSKVHRFDSIIFMYTGAQQENAFPDGDCAKKYVLAHYRAKEIAKSYMFAFKNAKKSVHPRNAQNTYIE